MRSISLMVCFFSLIGSTVGLGQTISTTELSCRFKSLGKERQECISKIVLCNNNNSGASADCQEKVFIECNNDFDLFDSKHVESFLAHQELRVSALQHGDQAEIRVSDFTGVLGKQFFAELALIEHREKGKGLVREFLKGECKTLQPVAPQGSCQPSSALSVMVQGKDVVSYVPKGSWENSNTGISRVNVEGTSVPTVLIPTTNAVNSCVSNSLTGQTICTANNTDVYLLNGSSITNTLTSGASGTISFSGGSCTNCGVSIDAIHNRAVIGMAVGGLPGYQFLNLTGTPSFEAAFTSKNSELSENVLIDPFRNWLLSAAENNNFEIVNIATSSSPTFFEQSGIPVSGELDSSGEDCSTGIALAPAEFTDPSQVFITDLTQATFTPGSPAGTWAAPSQVQTLTESSLSAGASGVAIAQGTHTGVVTGEFGGNSLTAITLPTVGGSGTPAITDWVTCSIPGGFVMGDDPHTVNAYQSPASGDAIGLLVNQGATIMAVVDLTKMLNPSLVPRTPGGHGCASGTLPTTVVRFISIP